MTAPSAAGPRQTTTPGADGPTAGALATPQWAPPWLPEWVVPVGASVLVLVFAWAVGRLLVRLLGRRIARRFERASLTRLTIRGIRLGVYLLGLLVVLRINGLNLGSIALSVTVFSAVVGVILAPIVGSYVNGVFLLADQPYEIGDMVELSERQVRGFVDDITLRYTKLLTLDNTFLVIPNAAMRERDIVNYSAEDARTRLSLDVVVTYESDIAAARSLIERGAREVDVVIEGGPGIRVGGARYPAGPTCYIDEFGDNGVKLRLRYWVTEPYKLLTARSLVQTAVRSAVQDSDADVEMAYPHTHLVFDDTSGAVQVSTGPRRTADDTTTRGRRGSPARRTDGAVSVGEPSAETGGEDQEDGPEHREGSTGEGPSTEG